MKKETFCILPWVHLATQPDGALNICCLSSNTLKADSGEELRLDTHSLEQIWGSQDLQNVRNKMLSNQKIHGCDVCYRDESNGKTSPRQMHNDTWTKKLGAEKIQHLIQSSQEDPQSYARNHQDGVLYFNFRFSNNCNLRCRMCFPMSSNGLSKEFRELIEKQETFPRFYKTIFPQSDLVAWSQNETFVKNMNLALPYLKEVYITGGEPMIGKDTLQFLKMAVESNCAQNIELTFHTNTTHWNESVTELFAHFKKVTIHCSIDGFGLVDEYIRYPTRFHKVEDVFDKYLELTVRVPTVSVSIACSVSIYNIFSLPELVKWYLKKKSQKEINLNYIQFTSVHYPEFLNINIIPPSLRHKALSAIRDCLELIKSAEPYFSPTRTSLKPLLDVLQLNTIAEKADIDSFLAFHKELDTHRNQSVSHYIPDVEYILNFYSSQDVKYSQPMFPTTYKRLWLSHLGHLVTNKNLNYLEIGSYEGQSSAWVMKNILPDTTCMATVIEPFFIEGTKQRFYKNMDSQKLLPRLHVFEEPSESALKKLKPANFDLIYVDGDHTYEAVLKDALQSWPLLKIGGIMVFDDYYWMKWLLSDDQRPEHAIDHFISMMGGQLEVIHRGLQVFVKKCGEIPDSTNTHAMLTKNTVAQKNRVPWLIGKMALAALYRYHSVKIDKNFKQLNLRDPEEMYPSC